MNGCAKTFLCDRKYRQLSPDKYSNKNEKWLPFFETIGSKVTKIIISTALYNTYAKSATLGKQEEEEVE